MRHFHKLAVLIFSSKTSCDRRCSAVNVAERVSSLLAYCMLHAFFDMANVSRMRALNEPKTAKWGLFTKWRRSGSAGHFCTRVHAGCMAGCVRLGGSGKEKKSFFLFHYPLVRPRKTHLRRATFCSFCLNTLWVILTDDLCVRRT